MPTPLPSMDCLQRPSHLISVGSRPARARRVWSSWAKAGAAVLLASVAAVTQAHNDPSLVSPGSGSLVATTQSAQLAPSRFLEKAHAQQLEWVSEQGQVDAGKLLEQWRQGGVSVEQAYGLINVMVLTQSPVVSRTKNASEWADRTSQATQSVLEIQTERNARFFLRSNAVENLVDRGLISPVEALNMQDGQGRSWGDALSYWETLGRQKHSETISTHPMGSASDMAHARQALERAVDTAGLASLRVPLPLWSSAPALEALAHRLVEANATLEKLTGLSGQLLGLEGRVSLTPFSPSGNAFAYRAPDGTLRLDTQWEDVPHEWVHVLDSVLRTTPEEGSVLGGGSLSHQVFTSGATDAVGQAWQHVSSQWTDGTGGGQWLAQRQTLLSQMNAGSPEDQQAAVYFGSPSEMMGYAWGAYVQSQVGKDSVFHDPRQSQRQAYDGQHGPTVDQAGSMKSGWQELFATLGQQWWKGTPSVALPPANQWRQTRQQAVVTRQPPKAVALGRP